MSKLVIKLTEEEFINAFNQKTPDSHFEVKLDTVEFTDGLHVENMRIKSAGIYKQMSVTERHLGMAVEPYK